MFLVGNMVSASLRDVRKMLVVKSIDKSQIRKLLNVCSDKQIMNE